MQRMDRLPRPSARASRTSATTGESCLSLIVADRCVDPVQAQSPFLRCPVLRVGVDELQPVLRSLRTAGVNIVAIHHHMTHEEPRILFLHYWGRGKAADLAKSVKKALDLTGWEGKKKET